MLDKIIETLTLNCQVSPNLPLLVAVSGGPDSLCLFDCLLRLGYFVILAHMDHQLRPESAREADQLGEMARQTNIPACFGKADVAEFANTYRISIEEAARTIRYKFLFDQALHHDAQAVVTGHTANDQVETVLMHLLRGSGSNGLCGMAYRSLPNYWSGSIPLVRPLLGTWRKDILEYLQERRLVPFEDATNQDMRFYRNRIRHELIPLLESYNPGFCHRLWQTARIIREDRVVLEPVLDSAWKTCLSEDGQMGLLLDLDALRGQPTAIQRYLLQRAARQLRPELDNLDTASLERACTFIRQPPISKHAVWIGGLNLQIITDKLLITGGETLLPGELGLLPQFTGNNPLQVNLQGRTAIAENWFLEAEILTGIQPALSKAEQNADPFQAWIDLNSIYNDLHIRKRQAGDFILPLGLNGHKIKISDLMINLKVPRQARKNWPIITSGDQIVWIPGLRLAEPFKLNRDSQSAVFLRLVTV